MDLISLGIAVILFIAIFLISKTKYFFLAAVVANFPMLSLFTYFQSRQPRVTAIYLSVFSFIVSLSFFVVYCIGGNNKYLNVLTVFLVWSVFSATAFMLLRHAGVIK